jgi:hypothetical protein
MSRKNPSSPAKVAAARANGRKGGTKNPRISRFNALRHGLNAKKISILEGKHLPEYPVYVDLLHCLADALHPLSILEMTAVEMFVIVLWRTRRGLRFDLSITEKGDDHGMSAPGMPNLLRYLNSANRHYAECYDRVDEICRRKQVGDLADLLERAENPNDDPQPPSEVLAMSSARQTDSADPAQLDSEKTEARHRDNTHEHCSAPTGRGDFLHQDESAPSPNEARTHDHDQRRDPC